MCGQNVYSARKLSVVSKPEVDPEEHQQERVIDCLESVLELIIRQLYIFCRTNATW